MYLQVHEGPELRSYILIQRAGVQALSKSVIHKASAFVSVKHTHTHAGTYTLLQVVLEPVEITSECPLPYIKFKWPGYKAETSVEAILIVVVGNCDACVL